MSTTSCFTYTENDIEPVFEVITFSGSSISAGDTECVEVQAVSDDLDEAIESLYLVIFSLSGDPIFEIDDTRSIVPIFSENSHALEILFIYIQYFEHCVFNYFMQLYLDSLQVWNLKCSQFLCLKRVVYSWFVCC